MGTDTTTTATTGRHLRPAELVPGVRYRVALEDCCVQGHFTAVFVGFRQDRTGPTDATRGPASADDFDRLVFEGAEVGPDWSRQWTLTEAP